MKKPLLAVAALLPATLIAVLYVWLETSESTPAGAVRHETQEQAASPLAAEPNAAAQDASTTSEKREGAPPREEGANAQQENARTDVDASKRVRVNGVVRIPPGTPSDEQLEVLVFRDGSDPARTASDSSEDKLAKQDKLVSRTPVGGDGTFHVDAQLDTQTTWLALRGRYLYVDDAKKLVAADANAPVEIEPKLGAWVSGTIAAPEGASASELELAKTELKLKFDEMKVVNYVSGGAMRKMEFRERDTLCASDASFEFRGIGGEIDYDLRVQCEHFAAHKTPRFALAPGKHVQLDVHLLRGGTLVGRVRDNEGHGIADAEVTASVDPVMWGQGGFKVRTGKSDESGAFELAAVTPGKLDVTVKREGYLDRQLKLDVSDGQRTDAGELVLGRGEAISGRVTWPDGTPVADTKVEVQFDPAALGGMSAFNAFQGAKGDDQTDAEGRFEVTGLGKGPFVVEASAKRDAANGSKNAASSSKNDATNSKDDAKSSNDEAAAHEHVEAKDEGPSWHAKLANVKPGTHGLELVLSAPMAVTGRVVDRNGAAITAFRIEAREQTGGMIPGMGGSRESKRFTDEQGHFELGGLSPAKWAVDASAEGYTRCSSVEVTLPAAPDAAPLEFVLQRGGTISGVVLSPTGVPIAGADVGPKLSLQDIMKLRGDDEAGGPSSARSDTEGHFVLRNLAAGKLAIVARAEGSADSEPAQVEVSPEQEVSGVTLQLREGGKITGEVYGRDGAPLAGAQILAQITMEPMGQRFAPSDARGHFEFEHMAPATYNVMHLPFDRMKDAPEGGEPADFTAVFSDMKMTSATVVDGQETHVTLGAPPKNPVELPDASPRPSAECRARSSPSSPTAGRAWTA
jgi:protocatechuate 3,4-dioxygenase beta subunit